MTRAQMLEALTAIDRQLQAAAQPLARSEADLVIAALGQDIFAGGALSRLTGRYPQCATARALGGITGRSDAEQRVITLLEKRREQLAQIREQLRIRALLEIWLFLHIPLTIALIAALVVHVISVFFYW
jgi:hypothetical protein